MKFRVPFMKRKENNDTLVVLLAALHPDQAIIEILASHRDITIREAYSIRGVMQDLPGVQLVILDELMIFPDSPMEILHQTLEMNHIPVVSQRDFLSASEDWLGRARLTNSREIGNLPPRQVNLMNWSGGVGKTTLAMTISKRFVERTGLPAALMELSMGGSALQTKISTDLPDFFELMTHKRDPGKWCGVNIFPMDGRAFDVLWAEDPDGVRNYLAEVRRKHTLFVVDCFPGHPLFRDISHNIHGLTNLVVISPRADSISLGRNLLQEISEPSYCVLNMFKSLVDQSENGVTVHLPYKETWANTYDSHLVDPLLALIYPGWRSK